MSLNRRQFLEATAAVAMAAPAIAEDAPAKLPTRPFGKNGFDVSILGFGSGSRFLMYEKEDEALAALEQAIGLGVTYIDTAHSYGDGKSEERIGRLMPTHREKVTLATKLAARTAEDAKRQLERSLKGLQTDRLDVLHIHALRDLDDLRAVEAKGGVLEALYQFREQKIARAIGITCHASPEALAQALDRHDFDCTQMALNAALARMAETPQGMKATRMPAGGFEELALPIARRKNLGIIAMKVFGQDQLTGAAPIESMLRYSLSLPVSLCSLGMPKPEYIAANVASARAFTPLSDVERRRLSDSLSQTVKAAHRAFYRDHVDA